MSVETQEEHGGGEAAQSGDGLFLGNGGGVVSANGKAYAVGLIWEASDPFAGSPDKVAKAAAKKLGAQFYCLRGKEQYGLGSRSVGHKGNMPSLAAMLADITEGSLVAIYTVGDGYYLCAVRDDQVLAGCDRLIQNRQDAVDAFGELFYGSTWDAAHCPEEWEFEGTTPASLDETVIGVKPSTRLKDMSNRTLLIKLGVVAALIAVAAVGWQQYTQWEAAREADQQAKARLEAQKQAEENAKKLPPPPPMPFEGKPQAAPSVNACVQAMYAAKISIPGWKPETMICDGKAVTLRMRRDGGTVNWIGATLNRDNFKPTVAPQGDGEVSVSWPIAAAPSYPADAKDKTVGLGEVRRYIVSNFDEVFQKVDIGSAESTPYYAGLSFSFRTRNDPSEYAEILAPIPGMLLTAVKLDLASWTWTIEGNVYEKLTPPPPPQQRR
jgi:hypothetical protein